MRLLTFVLIGSVFAAGWSPSNSKKLIDDAGGGSRAATQAPNLSNTGTLTVMSYVAGPTPFIANVTAQVNPLDSLQSIRFTIAPKPGSVTRAVSATYTIAYLQSQGRVNPGTGTITLAVFGLYSSYSNGVTLTSCFTDGTTETDNFTLTTGPYNDSCGYTTPTIVKSRTGNTDLSYDFLILKSNCGAQSPVVIDTDGAVRWVGTTNTNTFASIFFDNAFYVAARPAGSSEPTAINRVEWDGTFAQVRDYSALGITSTAHHNYDPGKYGMLVEVDTVEQIESVIIEIDPAGNILKSWNLADIISAAMIAGGDNPSQFVASAPNDWFHSNAATYRRSDDSLVISSRENFVISIDYETGAINWILGDPTKKWHQFQSLRNYALNLAPNTSPPIGQHSVSITSDDNLLMFDNGYPSLNQFPAGASRTESFPRKYHIDTQLMVATEIWSYANNPALFSPFCSSIYEDKPLNYLIDYAIIQNLPGNDVAGLMGFNATGVKIFEYRYPTSGCNTSWNAIPIHMERLVLTTSPIDEAQIRSIALAGSNVTVSFSAIGGSGYMLESKDSLEDASWQEGDQTTPDCIGTAVLTDGLASQHSRRFYRVRLEDP